MYFKCVLLSVAVILVIGSSRGEEMEDCLKCICVASTDCRIDTGCNSHKCGLFGITYDYWYDAVQYNNGQDFSKEAYQRCSTDSACSSETVKNYMLRYGKDCNGDGMVDCYDYAKIHKRGPNLCETDVQPEFRESFEMCMRS